MRTRGEDGGVEDAIMWGIATFTGLMVVGAAVFGVQAVRTRDVLERAVAVLAQGETVDGCVTRPVAQAAVQVLEQGGLDPNRASLVLTANQSPYGALTGLRLSYPLSARAAGYPIPWTLTLNATVERMSQFVPGLTEDGCSSGATLSAASPR